MELLADVTSDSDAIAIKTIWGSSQSFQKCQVKDDGFPYSASLASSKAIAGSAEFSRSVGWAHKLDMHGLRPSIQGSGDFGLHANQTPGDRPLAQSEMRGVQGRGDPANPLVVD
jgi:hypothetical protein